MNLMQCPNRINAHLTSPIFPSFLFSDDPHVSCDTTAKDSAVVYSLVIIIYAVVAGGRRSSTQVSNKAIGCPITPDLRPFLYHCNCQNFLFVRVIFLLTHAIMLQIHFCSSLDEMTACGC